MKQQINFKKYAPKKGEVLVLKSLPASMLAYNDFLWPKSGYVEAPDWSEKAECGNGLHGWKWGAGNADLRCKDEDAVWLVLRVEDASIVDLTDKVKFKGCNVVFLVLAILHDLTNVVLLDERWRECWCTIEHGNEKL